jgi:hydrogenase maturation protease
VRTVLIGVGNPVRADDAVGLHVARAVRARAPGACDVEELWAGGLSLVEAMSGYDRAIVVDALAGEGVAPGEVVRLGLDELGSCRTVTNPHDTSLPEGLALWREAGVAIPSRILVLGVGAVDLATLREELSPAVAAAVPRAVEAVLDELAREERG